MSDIDEDIYDDVDEYEDESFEDAVPLVEPSPQRRNRPTTATRRAASTTPHGHAQSQCKHEEFVVEISHSGVVDSSIRPRKSRESPVYNEEIEDDMNQLETFPGIFDDQHTDDEATTGLVQSLNSIEAEAPKSVLRALKVMTNSAKKRHDVEEQLLLVVAEINRVLNSESESFDGTRFC